MGLADYLRASNGSGEAVMAVVVSNRLVGSSTLIVDSVLNWPTRGIATSGDLDINTGLIDPDTATVFKYHLDGSIVMIDGFAPGYSDVGNKANQVVVIKPATHWADQVADGLDALDGSVVRKTDTSLAGNSFFLDEDNMASNSATKVPSQQSVKAYVDAVLLRVYPVGSIYISVDNTNPGTLFGGTWIAWGSGRTLVGVDAGQSEFNTVEKTGGTKSVTLTIAQMPSHQHQTYSANSAVGYQETQALGGSPTPAYSNPLTRPAGGGGAHNNLQPYITCYFWKRTA